MSSEKVAIWLKLAITTTFVSGALIFLYPFVANIINTQVDKHRIAAFQEQLELDEANQLAKKAQREEELKKNPHLGMKLEDELFDDVDKSSTLSSEEIKSHLIGSISIPKINSQLPIFDETTSSFLQEGVTLLPGTSYPTGGKNTHSVLTGHTGLPNKKLFTDLKDLNKKDVIYLNVLNETIAYEVDQIKTVLPDELDDLKLVDGEDYLTLVTCTPYMVNTHRLLVRGHRVAINYEKVAKEEKQIDRTNKRWLAFYLTLVGLLILLMLGVIYKQWLNYQIMKRRYRLSFKILLNGRPQKDLTFKLMDKHKRHEIKQNKRPLMTDEKGKLKVTGLKGNHYWLVQEKPVDTPLEIKCWVPNYKAKRFKVALSKKADTKWQLKTRQEKQKK